METFDVIYTLALVAVFCLLAWQPYGAWRFQHRLGRVASDLADGKPAHVKCHTAVESIFFGGDARTIATGSWDSGDIEILPRWCKALKGYLDHPEDAGTDELWSLNMFTHEAMHVRGERNEARTNCQAVQRNYRTARLLGIPDAVAQENAVRFYEELYLTLRDQTYFSQDCAPGKGMDERLSDSTWSFLKRRAKGGVQ